ncbi:hypothetical protein BH23ACT2_BH23ACT2_19030 [soil metagenome]
MICAACGATAEASARFCATCGRPLRTIDDERRVVTVVFADLVGFTTLSERLDPERVKNLVDRCFDRLAGDVTTFGGQVDKIVGDAMVALFGAPTAHEDDAERAVRAALRMQGTLREEAVEIGQDLEIRIGVNTGEVLVGAMHAAGSVTAMGDVVNTASRLQTSAAPGEVLVGPATHAATHRTIAYEARGTLAARGREEPVETWRAVAPTVPPGSRPRRVDVPLVGREHEVGLLHHAVDTSITHERALLVLLVGDVGMGKSRLADEVGAWAQATHDTVLREGRCLPYGEANVWWPIANAMATGFGLGESEDVDAARRSVGAQVATVMRRPSTDPEATRVTEGLLTLLGYDAPRDTDPTAVRQESGRSAAVYAEALAAQRPLVLALSDLHWADDAVLGLIDDVFSTVHHRPLVVLATARPSLLERWSPRPGRHNTLVLHVDALSRSAAADLLATLVGQPVPSEVADVVLDRSGGNPFFLEELVSLMDGAGDGEGLERVATMPDTLRGLVAARLDDLDPPVRAVLQNAAVIGQQGPAQGLREMAAAAGRVDDIDDALDRLVSEEIMVVDGDYWSFRSDLVRQVAYRTVTKADRAASHLGIARYLEHKAAEGGHRPVWLVDQLAHHYATGVSLVAELGPLGRATAASDLDELTERARNWVVQAAERARRDQALPTAIRLFGQALALGGTAGVVDPEETARLHLARAEVAVEAWDLATAHEDLAAADGLVDQVGFPTLSCRGLVLRGRVEHMEGNPDTAVVTLTEAAQRYELADDHHGRAEALRQRGMVELFAGRLAEAEDSASAAQSAFEQVGDRAGEAWALQNLAWIAFVTGRIDEADRRVQGAVDVFSDLHDTRGMAWSLGLLGWIRFQQRRVVEASALADRVLREARSRNDPWATAMMTLLSASIDLWSGETERAVDLASEARRAFEALGDAHGLGQADAVLGRALVMVGRTEEGFTLLGGVATAEPEPPVRVALDGGLGHFARLATALQVGEPDRAADVLADLEGFEGGGIGGDNPAVALGLSALQHGDVALAERYIDPGGPPTTDPNLVAARALMAAASGQGDAEASANEVTDLAGSTYLDESVATLGAAVSALAEGRPADAVTWIEKARSTVGATDDRVAQMMVELAAVEVATTTGASDLTELRDGAERRVSALGLDPYGWRTAFALTRAAVR